MEKGQKLIRISVVSGKRRQAIRKKRVRKGIKRQDKIEKVVYSQNKRRRAIKKKSIRFKRLK